MDSKGIQWMLLAPAARISEFGKTADCPHLKRTQNGSHNGTGDLICNDVGTSVPARADKNLRVAEAGNRIQSDVVHRSPAIIDGVHGYKSEDNEAVSRGKINDAGNYSVPCIPCMSVSAVLWTYFSGFASKFFLHISEQK
jgi:hypothetical protein